MEESIAAHYQRQDRVPVNTDLSHNNIATESADGPQLRVVGAPLPAGNGGNIPSPQPQAEPRRLPAAPSPGNALATPQPRPKSLSNLQRALNLVKTVLPLIQKVLPLIDGNIASTFSSILSPAPPPPLPAPVPARIDLSPIQESITALQTQNRELRDQFIEHNSSLKRVEDQLEMVREATDRNTLEQQELLEDLKAVGGKVNLVALVAIGLLAFSVLVNLLLYMHIQRVLP